MDVPVKMSIAPPAGAASGGAPPTVASAIVDVARDLARTVPPPRGAPYFYLDAAATYDLRVLDSFCTQGIFRKYEFALDLGSGLGGRARWLAARSGCRIVGVDPCVDSVVASTLLNHRAHMDDQVTFQVGRLDRLPLRDRIFTHVWIVDPPAEAALARVCVEVFRVLRPGASFAMHAPRAFGQRCDDVLEQLRAIGFIEAHAHDVTLTEIPHSCRVARDRWRCAGHPASPPESTVPAPQLQTAWQAFARRPA